MADLRDEYLTMPDDELRKIYKGSVRLQKVSSVLPLAVGSVCAILFTLSGFYYLTGYSVSYDQNAAFANPFPIIFTILYYIMTVINGFFLLSDSARVMKKAAIAFIPIHLVFLAVHELFGCLTFIQTLLSVYLILSGCANIFLVKKIDTLRNLPSFPFNSERRKMVAESTLTREQMIGYMQRMDKNQCTSVGCEDILEGKIDKHLPKEPDKETYFQQHKLVYRYDSSSEKK